MRDAERQRHRQREKQAPCREPNVGLDTGTPGSHPGLKAEPPRLPHLFSSKGNCPARTHNSPWAAMVSMCLPGSSQLC